jgi:hypothetical protein
MNDPSPTDADTYFLSYSRTDQEFALRLAEYVRTRGVRLWVDQLDIRPSEHWDRAIERAVRDCRGLVVVLSPRSVVSDNVADEISFAIDGGKSVLPVMIERCNLPLRIARMQVIDATSNDDRALEACLAELRRTKVSLPRASSVHPAARPIPATDVEALGQLLARYLGPIATLLARRESKAASTMEELAQRLAPFIPSESEREEFVRKVSKYPPVSKS